MRQLLTIVWAALLLACLAPPTAAQTPCDGAPPSDFFIVPASGGTFVFPYVATDHDAGVVSYTLTFRRQSGPTAPLSTQVVTKAATTVVGATATPGVTCYAIPVVPVSQIPKGVPLVATLIATASAPALSSAEGPPTGPFGSRLSDPALRPKP